MDSNKILSDDNLKKLDFINSIDTYSIVDREFNKKRENKKIWGFVGVITVLISISILAIMINRIIPSETLFKTVMINKIIPFNTFLKAIIGYYVLSIWAVMLLVVPIIKRKRVGIN